MEKIDREIDRILTHLRNQIRDRGFTQLQVQAQLDWGRSYISQLLTKQKALRIEQVLLILDVIGVNPADFFFDLYGPPSGEYAGFQGDLMGGQGRQGLAADEVTQQLDGLRRVVLGVLDVMVDKELLEVERAREFKLQTASWLHSLENGLGHGDAEDDGDDV